MVSIVKSQSQRRAEQHTHFTQYVEVSVCMHDACIHDYLLQFSQFLVLISLLNTYFWFFFPGCS